MDIIRDVLDMPLVDPRGEPVGRVDGVIASYRDGAPLRLSYLEIGGTTLARRLHPRLARWTRRLAHRFSPSRGRACRIPFADIETFGKSLHLKTNQVGWRATAWERWLRDNVVERIPGA